MKFTVPSRPDAWPMKRDEKQSMMFFMNAVSILQDVKEELAERIGKTESGQAMADRIAEDSLKLLEELRVTIPENQRKNLYYVGLDQKMQMVPKLTPSGNNMIIPQGDFRELVDASRTQCGECAKDSDDCKACKLYQLYLTILPLDRYDGVFLCPYNLAVWKEDEK